MNRCAVRQALSLCVAPMHSNSRYTYGLFTTPHAVPPYLAQYARAHKGEGLPASLATKCTALTLALSLDAPSDKQD